MRFTHAPVSTTAVRYVSFPFGPRTLSVNMSCVFLFAIVQLHASRPLTIPMRLSDGGYARGDSTREIDEWDASGTTEVALAFRSCCTDTSSKGDDGTFLVVVGVGVGIRTVAPLHGPCNVFNS